MKNEIKDNEYIRTNTGKIDKVINANYYMPQYIECEKDLIFKSNIVKHSPNLIDLICEGDYVNGEIVIDVLDGFVEGTNEIELLSHKKIYRHHIEDIKTIVTKEHFEAISYKVERKG